MLRQSNRIVIRPASCNRKVMNCIVTDVEYWMRQRVCFYERNGFNQISLYR